MILDMTKKAKVEASANTLGLVLSKKGLNKAPTMRVATLIDISGSMDDEIRDGSVQKVFNQLMGVAFKFDDNAEIDMWIFNTHSYYVGTAGINDLDSYVKQHGIRAEGGTAYSPAVRDVTKFMFGPRYEEVAVTKKGLFGTKTVMERQLVEPSNTPVLVLMITDGAPYNEGSTVSSQFNNILPAFKEAAKYDIYFQMIGVNNQGEKFEVISRLADELPNVGFVKMSDFSASDEHLYEAIVTDELIEWIKKFENN